jgi:HemY protein
LAEVLAHARPGDGPEPRFERVRDLVGASSDSLEGAYALARAAVAAQRWDAARKTLEPFLADQPQARFCALMADIEEAAGDKGRAREWLARAVKAPRDPIWVSDGVASPRWTPVSPVSGDIVPCEWKVPFEMLGEEAAAEIPAPAAIATAPRPIAKPPMAERLRPPDDPGLPEDFGEPEAPTRRGLAAEG